MKILLIFNDYQYRGGEGTYCYALKTLLESKGHFVYFYNKDSRLIHTRVDKIRVAFNMLWNIRVKNELEDIINTFKPDIAHFHNIYPLIGPTAYRICKKYNIPIIQTIHNYKFFCQKNSLFRNGKICEICIKRKSLLSSVYYGCYHNSRIASLAFFISYYLHSLAKTFNYIDAYIFPSLFTKNYYMNNLHIPNNKSFIVPNYIDFHNKDEIQNNDLRTYFLYIGRLSEEKGIIQLLQVFRKLPHLKLIVVGDGPLRKQVDVFRKYKNIVIKNEVDYKRIFTFINRSIAVIVPSLWYEVLPNVILESFALGIPVIAPHNKNFDNIIKHNITGLLYRQNDEKDMIVKITYMKKFFDRFKKNIIQNEYNKNYSKDLHYTRIIHLYHQLTDTKE